MEALTQLGTGFADALTPINLLFALLGVLLGTAVGVLPGIGPAMTVALLLPITYVLEPTGGVHHVRRHLLRRHVRRVDHVDPAEHAGRVQLDHDRARGQQDGQGRTRRRGAGHGGASARSWPARSRTLLLALVAPPVVELAITLGPADYFALAVLAFLAAATVLGSSPLRGLASLCLGLFLGLVGTDLLTGQQRFTFGIPQLADGIDVVVVAVGLFAVGEALYVASRLRHGPVQVMSTVRPLPDPRGPAPGPGSRGCAAPRSGSPSAPCRPVVRRSRRSSPTRPRSG